MHFLQVPQVLIDWYEERIGAPRWKRERKMDKGNLNQIYILHLIALTAIVLQKSILKQKHKEVKNNQIVASTFVSANMGEVTLTLINTIKDLSKTNFSDVLPPVERIDPRRCKIDFIYFYTCLNMKIDSSFINKVKIPLTIYNQARVSTILCF